jgi:arylsulfatase A-like enzyme
VSHFDWLPTLLAAAGEPDIKEKLKIGYKAGDKNFKVYLDGYNLLPYLTGKEKNTGRRGKNSYKDQKIPIIKNGMGNVLERSLLSRDEDDLYI